MEWTIISHVVFIHPVGVVGGAERVLLSCVEAIIERKIFDKVTTVLLSEGELAEQLRLRGSETILLSFPERLQSMGDTQIRNKKFGGLPSLMLEVLFKSPAAYLQVRKISRLLRSLHPTVVHSHGLKTHVLAALALRHSCPLIWHLHDYYTQRPVMLKVLRKLRSRVSACIAISDSIKQDAHSFLPTVPVTTVRNCVDLKVFTPSAAACDLDRLAQLSPSPSSLLKIGLVATYANWKGHDLFIAAVKLLSAKFQNFRAYIVGSQIYKTTGSQVSEGILRELVAKNGLEARVGFIPFQANPASVYTALDLVVHASTRPEPFGLTIAEAMACGRPVIYSKSGGAVELVEEGRDAVGFESGNSQDLFEKLLEFCERADFRKSIGQNARESALVKFSKERFAAELEAVYGQVLAATHSG